MATSLPTPGGGETTSIEDLAARAEGAKKPVAREHARDEARENERTSMRDYYFAQSRNEGRQLLGHEKFHIDEDDFPPDCDCVWMPLTINGMPSGQVERAIGNGWVAARACDFPMHSGYSQRGTERLVAAGRRKEVGADDLVEKDGQVLLVRPKVLSARADEERLKEARSQVAIQAERLDAMYRPPRPIRGASGLRHGVQFANSDELNRQLSDG